MFVNKGVLWLRDSLRRHNRPAMSPLGEKVASILDQAYVGMEEIEKSVMHARNNWENEFLISIVVPGAISSINTNTLTDIVILAHDANVRVEISGASSWGHLRLTFHECGITDLGYVRVCPTIERQLVRCRARMKERAAYITPTASIVCDIDDGLALSWLAHETDNNDEVVDPTITTQRPYLLHWFPWLIVVLVVLATLAHLLGSLVGARCP